MTNPNPSPLVVQTFMAELQGWTGLIFSREHQLLGVSPRDRVKWGVKAALTTVPNWPGSLDAARGLEVKNKPLFALCLFEIVFREENSDDPTLMVTGEVGQLLFATSDQWCLAWIRYKGYRWRECECCFGDGQAGDEICEPCSGDGGEFVKE